MRIIKQCTFVSQRSAKMSWSCSSQMVSRESFSLRVLQNVKMMVDTAEEKSWRVILSAKIFHVLFKVAINWWWLSLSGVKVNTDETISFSEPCASQLASLCTTNTYESPSDQVQLQQRKSFSFYISPIHSSVTKFFRFPNSFFFSFFFPRCF